MYGRDTKSQRDRDILRMTKNEARDRKGRRVKSKETREKKTPG